MKSKTPSVDYQGEIDSLHMEIERLEERVKQMDEKIHDKNERNAELGQSIGSIDYLQSWCSKEHTVLLPYFREYFHDFFAIFSARNWRLERRA